MKILLSADYFYPAQMGGPSNTIYWQAKALTRAGHEVTVVAISQDLPPSSPLDCWLTMDCGQVIYTRNPHFYLPVNHIKYGWRAIQKADIIHVNSLFYPASLVWVLMSRWLRKPVVWSPHGELSPAALRVRSQLKRLVLRLIQQIKPVIHFHATSPIETAHIRQYFGPNAVVSEIRNRMELPALVTPTPIDHLNRPYLLFIGRLHPIKAIDHLLRALGASQLFRDSAYELKIAGPATDKAYVRMLMELVRTLDLSAKVLFIGSVMGEQKEYLYANARLTILPSHAESFGNVVIESLAQGTPVVASTNTPWQLLETEGVGSWVPTTSDQLQTAIESYLTMPSEEYIGYRDRAYKLAYQQFNIMNNISELEDFYRQILAGQNKKRSE